MSGEERAKGGGAKAQGSAPRGRVIEEGPGARAAAAAASQAAKAERLAKAHEDPLEAAMADLAGSDRSKKLAAIFALGQAFAGTGAPDAEIEPVEAKRLARVVESLEAVIADRSKGSAWARKRAKRALKRIREADGPDVDGFLARASDDGEEAAGADDEEGDGPPG